MYCNKCGKELPDNTNFCVYCGADVSAESANLRYTAAQQPVAAARGVNNMLLIAVVAIIAVMLTGLMGWSYTKVEINGAPIDIELNGSLSATQGLRTASQVKDVFDEIDDEMGRYMSDMFSDETEFEMWNKLDSGVSALYFSNLASGGLMAVAIIALFVSVILVLSGKNSGITVAQAGFIIAALAALISIITSLVIGSSLDDAMRYVAYETDGELDIKYGVTAWVFVTLILSIGSVIFVSINKTQMMRGIR